MFCTFTLLPRVTPEATNTFCPRLQPRPISASFITWQKCQIRVQIGSPVVVAQRFRIKSQKRVEEMMSRSRLIVIVSHSTPLLRELCTNCLWMENGTIREYGEASPVLDAYDRAMGEPRRLLDTD